MSSTMYDTVSFCCNILTTILQNKILEHLRFLALDNTVVTQDMDALEPVTTMQEFDIEENNMKDRLNRKKKVVKFSLFYF